MYTWAYLVRLCAPGGLLWGIRMKVHMFMYAGCHGDVVYWVHMQHGHHIFYVRYEYLRTYRKPGTTAASRMRAQRARQHAHQTLPSKCSACWSNQANPLQNEQDQKQAKNC